MAAPARPNYVSPQVTLGWCSIKEPDLQFIEEDNPNDKGTFKAMLRLPKDDPETIAFLAEMQEHYDRGLEMVQAEKKRKDIKLHDEGLPWSDEVDRDTGEPTGNVIVRTKLKARVVFKKSGKTFDQRPKVFDAAGKVIADVPNIGPGSLVKVAGQVNCWFTGKYGMTLWCEAVQVIDLVEFSAKREKAEEYGFGAEEGYTDGESFPEADAPAPKGVTGNF